EVAVGRGGLAAEIAGELRQRLPVNGNPLSFHARKNRDERPLQSLVHGAHALAGEPWLEGPPEPQRDGAVVGGVARRRFRVNALKRYPRLSRPGKLVQIDGRMLEVPFRKRLD